MPGDLTGKLVLVTAASRWTGKQFAIALAQAGADVAANYRTREREARQQETGAESCCE